MDKNAALGGTATGSVVGADFRIQLVRMSVIEVLHEVFQYTDAMLDFYFTAERDLWVTFPTPTKPGNTTDTNIYKIISMWDEDVHRRRKIAPPSDDIVAAVKRNIVSGMLEMKTPGHFVKVKEVAFGPEI